jgi:histidine ammonia-lyase
MGANAATKTWQILENVERILAIELMNASQAIAFRRPAKTGPFLESFLSAFQEDVPFVKEDRILHYDIEKAIQFLQSFQLDLEA